MIICTVAAFSLAVTAAATEPVIEQNRVRELQQALSKALPGAESFEPVQEWDGGAIYAGFREDELVGHVVLTFRPGYSADISVLVGVDISGTVVAPIQVLSQRETPGLGSNVTQDWFRGQFEGKTYDDDLVIDRDLDGLAGATVSSQAVAGAVADALGRWAGAIAGVVTGLEIHEIPDGIYQGDGRGFGGNIVVEVEVRDGSLISIRVVEHTETPSIAGPALEAIPFTMIDRQTIRVDAYSGATATTKGIIEAVENAFSRLVADDPSVDLTQIPDGTYWGQAMGYDGVLEVEVEVKGGQLIRVEIVDSYEVHEYIADILALIPRQMLEEQKIEVDAYSGATETTIAIIEAVKASLEGADEPEEIELSSVPDGIYRGQAEGHRGKLTVEVDFYGGELIRIRVLDHEETPELADPAIAAVTEEILARQKIEVDAHSGATVTSEAIMKAIEDAARGALAGSADEGEFDDLTVIPDGSYQGSAEGFRGEVVVEVEFASGRLIRVEIMSHEETPELADPAIEAVTDEIVDRQQVIVDAYSGATATSIAIVEAVKAAVRVALGAD